LVQIGDAGPIAAGELPLAIARRVLTVLIAAAVVLAPIGAASAAGAPAHKTHHAMHHDHGAMQAAVVADPKGSKPCAGMHTRSCCCDDKNSCAQTCLQKCFGQMAVMPPERTSRMVLAFRVAPRPTERPPGWVSTPQLPPPRA
jgi:hypothetical protein